MTISLKLAASAAALGLLGACAQPLPASITADQVLVEKAELTRTASLLTAATMPTTGTVNYLGKIASDPNNSTGVIGDLSMDVNFATSGITGSVSKVNYIEDGTPDQELRGALDVNGTVSGTSMLATAEGTLTGARYGFAGSSNVTLYLSGEFKTDVTTADTIAGTVKGSGTGRLEFDADGGSFYAKQQ